MSKILLLEDNAITLKIIKTFLEAEGFQIIHRSNGKEGIECLKNETFDLVMTDIYMPVQNGLDTIKYIRKNYSQLKILAMSAGIESGNVDYLREAKELGATATLTKPINRKKMIELVRALIHDKENELFNSGSDPEEAKSKKIFYVDDQKTILKSIRSHFTNVAGLKPYGLITSNSTIEVARTLKNRKPVVLFIQYELLLKLKEHTIFLLKEADIAIIATVYEIPETINLPPKIKVSSWATRILEPDELIKLIKAHV